MNAQALIDTARSLVAGDKGLLAMDESNGTCNKRFVRACDPASRIGDPAASRPTGSGAAALVSPGRVHNAARRGEYSAAMEALELLGVPNAARQAAAYAERKQKRLEELIHEGCVAAFFGRAALCSGCSGAGMAHGGRILLKKCERHDESDPPRLRRKSTRCLQRQCLRPGFAAGQAGPSNFPARRQGVGDRTGILLCRRGRARRHGGARAGGMTALGVARRGDAAVLRAAGADVVVTKSR